MRLENSGQLALLDAVVFFAVSVVVSSVLLSYGETFGSVDLDSKEGTANPEEILGAFLNACIGSGITIQLSEPRLITEREKVSTCLAIEVEAIMGGLDPRLFSELNDVFTVILGRITNPVFQPHLVVLDMDSETYDAVLLLPEDLHVGGDQMAASTVLPCGAYICLVEVVLSAHALPEPVDVRIRDLDLRPSVVLSMADDNPGDCEHDYHGRNREVKIRLDVGRHI